MELRLFASHHAGGSPLPHPARTPRFPTGAAVVRVPPGMPLCDGRHLSSRSGRTAPHRRIAEHLRGAPAPTAPARAVQR